MVLETILQVAGEWKQLRVLPSSHTYKAQQWAGWKEGHEVAESDTHKLVVATCC